VYKGVRYHVAGNAGRYSHEALRTALHQEIVAAEKRLHPPT
jgi:hypothetical protein